MKLINKYNRFILPVFFILFLLSVVISYFLIKNVLQNELDSILLRTKTRIENYITQNQKLPYINTFNDQQVVFEKTNVLIEATSITSATQYIPEQNKYHISRKLVFGANVNGELYKISISEPLEGTKHLTILILKFAFLTILITLLTLVIINRYVLAKLWQPFYDSLHLLKSFKINSPTDQFFPPTSINEFTLMNEHFTQTINTAKKEYRILKEFTENASHESQTPISIIQSKLDLLLQQDQLTEKQGELMNSAYTALKRLSKLNQSLLLLAKIENSQFQLTQQIDLLEMLQNKIFEFQEFWQIAGITVSTDLNASVIKANPDLIDILFNNILSNATIHNQANGLIHLQLKQGGLEIKNTGKAEPLDTSKLFTRFYKGSSNSESTGLGLSLIKQICDVSCITPMYHYDQNSHTFIFKWQWI